MVNGDIRRHVLDYRTAVDDDNVPLFQVWLQGYPEAVPHSR
jgi:hypothetical protein